MDFLADKIALLSVLALPFLFAVTLHEAGQAYAAYLLGDPTPKSHGRLSLNPLVHIDPFGTVVIPLIAIFAGIPFLIGYAKPVIIDRRNLKKARRDMILVALAAPAGNLVVAIFFAYVARFAYGFGFTQSDWILQTAMLGIYLNAVFLVFNMLPIPPLDGSKLVSSFLPHDLAIKYAQIAPYGFFILMGLIIIAPAVVIWPSTYLAGLVALLVGVPL